MEKDKKMPDLKLKVCEKQCHQCLFSRNRIVSLARKKQILQQCIEQDAPFECHVGTAKNQSVICRGFYDRISVNRIRIAERMEWLTFVNPLDLMTKP